MPERPCRSASQTAPDSQPREMTNPVCYDNTASHRRSIRCLTLVVKSVAEKRDSKQLIIAGFCDIVTIVDRMCVNERGFEMKKEELSSLTITELKALAKGKKVVAVLGREQNGHHKGPCQGRPRCIREAGEGIGETGVEEGCKKEGCSKTAGKGRDEEGIGCVGRSTAVKRPCRRSGRLHARLGAKPAEQAPPLREWQLPQVWKGPMRARNGCPMPSFFTGMPDHKPPMPYDQLPHEYGSERMALLARDPYMAFSFWELPQARLEKEKAWFGWDSKLCVRVYDVTGVPVRRIERGGLFRPGGVRTRGSWYFDFGRPTPFVLRGSRAHGAERPVPHAGPLQYRDHAAGRRFRCAG